MSTIDITVNKTGIYETYTDIFLNEQINKLINRGEIKVLPFSRIQTNKCIIKYHHLAAIILKINSWKSYQRTHPEVKKSVEEQNISKTSLYFSTK